HHSTPRGRTRAAARSRGAPHLLSAVGARTSPPAVIGEVRRVTDYSALSLARGPSAAGAGSVAVAVPPTAIPPKSAVPVRVSTGASGSSCDDPRVSTPPANTFSSDSTRQPGGVLIAIPPNNV